MSLKIQILATAVLCGVSCFTSGATVQDPVTDGPSYTTDGKVVRPENYRAWPLIGTGLNMTYGPAGDSLGESPPFTNVFVNPSSYRSFLQSGKWPDLTVFVLEIRESVAVNRGEAGRNGWFQGEIQGMEIEVKDEKRFAGGWAFFGLGDAETGEQLPTSASCYACHKTNAAVDNTFVQFYPVLRDIAKHHGTLKAVPEIF